MNVYTETNTQPDRLLLAVNYRLKNILNNVMYCTKTKDLLDTKNRVFSAKDVQEYELVSALPVVIGLRMRSYLLPLRTVEPSRPVV